jgi:hypothetical protein
VAEHRGRAAGETWGSRMRREAGGRGQQGLELAAAFCRRLLPVAAEEQRGGGGTQPVSSPATPPRSAGLADADGKVVARGISAGKEPWGSGLGQACAIRINDWFSSGSH